MIEFEPDDVLKNRIHLIDLDEEGLDASGD
jgi:hypothetical protein